MWRLAALPVAGGLELGDPWGPFQRKRFYDSMKTWHTWGSHKYTGIKNGQ